MPSEVATAYVSIVPSFSGAEGILTKELTGATAKAAGSSGVGLAGQLAGSTFSSKMGEKFPKASTMLKWIGGAATGVFLGKAIKDGWDRSLQINQTEAELKGLGYTNQQISQVMSDANKAVIGTMFGLGDAAKTASQLVAAGVKPGKDLTQSLKSVGDAAMISGDSFQQMGDIYGKVAATGHLTGRQMMEMTQAGIPVQEDLAKSMHTTTANVSDLVSSGKIGFPQFSQAMQQSMGGAALASGTTMQGAMANLQAAIGRLFSTITTPVMNAFVQIILALIPALNACAPIFVAIGNVLATDILPPVVALIKWIAQHIKLIGGLVAVLATVWAAIKIGTAVQAAFNLVMDANPVTLVVLAILALVAALVYFFTQTKTGKKIWSDMCTGIRDAWDAVSKWLETAWKNIVAVAKPLWGGLKTFFKDLWTAVKDIFSGVWDFIKDLLTGNWKGLSKDCTKIWTGVKTFFKGLWAGIKGEVQTVWNAIKGFIEGLWKGIVSTASSIWGGLTGFFSGLWNGISSTCESVWGGIVKFFKGIPGDIKGAFRDLASGIESTFKSAFNAVAGWWNSTLGSFSWHMPSWLGGATLAIPKIPKLAEGGIIQATGLALVGERGPELLRLPKGAMVEPLRHAQPQRPARPTPPGKRIENTFNITTQPGQSNDQIAQQVSTRLMFGLRTSGALA